MKAKKGSIAPLLMVVVLISVALNVYLFREKGKAVLQSQNAKPVPQLEMNYAREIANALGMKPGKGRTEADVATDVKLLIREAPEAPKRTLSDSEVEKLSKLLKPEDREVLAEGQAFMKRVAGKQVLVIMGE